MSKPIHLKSLTDPRLAEMIKNGQIGVIPTDTIYGLVGAATSKTAIKKLYSLKTRKRQPGTTIAASIQQLSRLGFPSNTLTHASKYWPNAISVEMTTDLLPDYLKVSQTHMAARIPRDPVILALLAQTGPLMTTSANTPHAPTSHTINEAIAYFGKKVDFYVDAGDLGDRPPSTIIGFNENNQVIVYREGAVKL